MFFTSEISIPFTSKEDVMKEYPTWILKSRYGEEVFFQARALAGDKLYQEYLERINNKPEEKTVSCHCPSFTSPKFIPRNLVVKKNLFFCR